MGTNERNTMRIRELEEELSDEKIAEHFHNYEEDRLESIENARLARNQMVKSLVIIAALIVCIVLSFMYFWSIVT